ncbi:hypothetical protein CcNV_055 [Crangon crangon nudivirus]|uniref:Uncharacterized protein n=1 Tax=Crangon crangon nudivirus TaxID=2880838 RepID=A0AAE8Y4W4_9VIRU|nr:hypothetical protein QKT25_gp056 [Crangon crangon nudivirus]UBZ25540.1 hypothetical protein CcNV_055 [Crangon crangon nudivirus]
MSHKATQIYDSVIVALKDNKVVYTDVFNMYGNYNKDVSDMNMVIDEDLDPYNYIALGRYFKNINNFKPHTNIKYNVYVNPVTIVKGQSTLLTRPIPDINSHLHVTILMNKLHTLHIEAEDEDKTPLVYKFKDYTLQWTYNTNLLPVENMDLLVQLLAIGDVRITLMLYDTLLVNINTLKDLREFTIINHTIAAINRYSERNYTPSGIPLYAPP